MTDDTPTCLCGKPEIFDIFDLPWPECIYFGLANGDPDKSLCLLKEETP